MPLFGLIKRKQSTVPLSSNRRRTSASSSSVAHDAINTSTPPPPRSSSLSPPQLPQPPPPPPSPSLTPNHPSRPSSAANTTPPSRPRRTGGGRPSLEAIEPFGLSPSSGNNNFTVNARIPHQHNTSPIPSSSEAYTSPSLVSSNPTGYQFPNDIDGTTLGISAGSGIGHYSLSDDDRSLARPRPRDGTRTPVGEEDDIVFTPPSRSTVFGMYEHTLNRRSGYSTQSLPDDAFPSGASSLNGGRGRAASAGRSGNIQRPALATRQAAATVVGAVDTSERRPGGGIANTTSNSNPQSSPGAKSKIFGWFSFRSSKTNGASSVVVTPPPPPLHLPDGDIAERVKRLPLSPPHSPSSPTATSKATQARPQRPLLSPLVDADADDSGSFKVTNFRHVSPTSTSSSGHLLLGGGDGSGNGNAKPAKKRTKSASSFASVASRKAKPSKQQETPQLSPPKPSIPTPTLPSPKLSFFNSTSTTSLAQQQEPPSPTTTTSPFNSNNPPSSMPPPGAPRIRSRNDSVTSETGSQRVTAAAFRQAAQARKNSMSFGGGSPLLVPTQLVSASPSPPSIQAQSHGRTSVDSLFHLPPVGPAASGQRSQTPTSITRGNGGSSSPMPSPTATSFKSGAGGIRDKESPTSSSVRTFVPGHARSRSSTSDLSRPITTANEDSNIYTGSTSQTSLSDFANMTARLNGAAKGNATSTSDSALNENTEMGIGGLGRQGTITQRSVGVTALPASRSAPSPVNVNARGVSATRPSPGSNTSVPRSTPSPLHGASSPTATATARLRQVPGANKLGPSVSARPFQPPRSQSALGSYARSPASRSTPVVGSVTSLHSNTARPTTIAALSRPDIDSDTSESSSEVDSDESDDSKDDAPLQRSAQPRPPRPGTSMSTRTTATAMARSSLPLGADNVGKSGLPRPAQSQSTAADTATATGSGNGTTARMSQARSSVMPVAPLVNLAGKTISQTSRPAASPNSASSTTSFKKPTHPNASRSVDALSFPSSPSPPPAQRHSANALQLHHQPQGPFAFAAAANGSVLRMDGTPSPASSSIGDSSSGKLPVTPRDGSELGWNSHAHPNATTRRRSNTMAGSVSGESTLRPHMARSELGNRVGGPTNISTAKHGGHGHVKRHSVTFDESGMKDKGVRGILKDTSTAGIAEDQRMERRRSEARAAIELGNVVNGPPPTVDDDPDIISRLSSIQMQQRQQIGLGQPMNWDQWRMSQFGMSPGQPGSPASPFGMVPQPPINADPAFLAAHQQAMLIAKQTYQMAVAQQAMAAANDEWERGSNVTGFTRAGGGAPSSIYGTPSVYGMNMNMPMGMGMGMPMMGMGMGMTMPSMFPAPPASMYAGAGDDASVVGSTGGAGWGSASVYGASFTGPGRPQGNRRSLGGNSLLDTGSTLGNKSTGGLNRPARPRTRTTPSAGAGANPIAAHAARMAAANSHSVAPTSWRRPS